MKRFAATLLFSIALGGCGDATGILVEVTSTDLSAPDDVDALRFEALSDQGTTVDQTFDVEGAWPHSLTLVPASSDDSEVTITVTGLEGGAPVVQRVVHTSFAPGVTRRVEVVLSRACIGVTCDPGLECVEGQCVPGASPDAGVDAGSALDGGADAGRIEGIDGGRTDDAGRGRDGGALDAGAPEDGGPGEDAGADAAVSLDAGGEPDAGADAGPPPPIELIFSEYVEGSSNNKAVEVVNLGAQTVDLSRCELRLFSNGSETPSRTIALSGTVASGDVFVICSSSIEVMTPCDMLHGWVSHNGDDAYELSCDAALLDSFGQVGADPGDFWEASTGEFDTAEHVLTRDCSVTSGDTVSTDAFDPAAEWDGALWMDTATSLSGLGSRGCP